MTSADRRERLAAAGQWLRDARRHRGFATAAEFARALGIDKALISNYERGMTAVPDDRAEEIAGVLRMDIIEVRRNLGLWVPAGQEAQPTSSADIAAIAAMTADDFLVHLTGQILAYLETHTTGDLDAEQVLEEIRSKSA